MGKKRESHKDGDLSESDLVRYSKQIGVDTSRLQTLLEIIPVSEKATTDKEKYFLKKRQCYLVKEKTSKISYEIFVDMATHGAQGLVITRKLPEEIREKWGLKKTPIIWLTSNLTSDGNCINPSGIAKLSSSIMSFIVKADDGVVLIDGIEYLVSQNNFKSILNLIQLLNDKIMLSSSRIIISLDPMTLSERELHYIESEALVFEE